jgi:hypothetical protein
MSKVVWTPTAGWCDGPEVDVSTVASLNNRSDLTFVSDSQDCASIRFDFGPAWIGFEYDSYFVRAEDGEYKEIWGMSGIVPYNTKLVTRLV